MDCRQSEALLALWVGNDLAENELRRALQAHLESCDRCRQRSREFLVAQTALQETRLTAPPDLTLWPRICSRLNEWNCQPHFAHFNVWVPTALATVACCLLVMVALVEVQRKWDERPLPTTVVTSPRTQLQQANIDYVGNREVKRVRQQPVFLPETLPRRTPYSQEWQELKVVPDRPYDFNE